MSAFVTRSSNSENFYTLAEARIVIESWRRFYNNRLPRG